MRITKLEAETRNRDRIAVHVDHAFRCSLAAELVDEASLAVGDTVEEALLSRLEARDVRHRIRDDALNLLSYRMRSAAELRRRLSAKGYEDDAIEACIRRLEEKGYLDDAAFAEAFVRDRLRLRPRGRYGLERELGARGVPRDAARTAIDHVFAEEEVDEAGLARDAGEAWLRRQGNRRDGDPEAVWKNRRRLYAYLGRRGFDRGVIRRVVDEMLGDD